MFRWTALVAIPFGALGATNLPPMPPMPLITPPPPSNTNLYYLSFSFANVRPMLFADSAKCWEIDNLPGNTNPVGGRLIVDTIDPSLVLQMGTSVLIRSSNYLYGHSYLLMNGISTRDTFTGKDIWQSNFYTWPDSWKPPLTNFVTIGCTGELQIKMLGLGSAWVDTTNKTFKLSPSQTAYWRSKAKETITITLTNNQPNLGQFMHRQ